MLDWIKKIWRRFKVFILLVPAIPIALAAPIMPSDMEWVVSYKTVEFDTPDGDIGLNEYAVDDSGEELIIRTANKNEAQHELVPLDFDTGNKRLIGLTGELACFDEFLKRNGERNRKRVDCEEYKRRATIRDYPQPIGVEFVPMLSGNFTDAAVSFDASSTSGLASNANSVEWSHTIVASENGAAVAMAINDNDDTIWSTTATTFNATAMTRATQQCSDGGASDHCIAQYVVASATEGTGAKTVHIELAGGDTEDMVGSAHTYTEVDQVTPQDGSSAAGGDDGTNPLTLSITSETDDLVVGFAGMEQDDLSGVGEDQTQRINNLLLNAQEQRTSDQLGEATAIHHYDRDTTNNRQWTISAFNLNTSLCSSVSSDFCIQRGEIDFGASENTITVNLASAVSATSSAVVRITNTLYGSSDPAAGTTGNRNVDDIGATVSFIDVSTIEFTRQSSGVNEDVAVTWEVWEYIGSAGGDNEFIVRFQDEVGMASGNGTVDQAVSGVSNASNTVPFITGTRGFSVGQYWDRHIVTALVTADGFTLSRADTNDNTTSTVAVVEFTGSNWGVYNNVIHALVSTNAVETTTFDGVNAWDEAFITAGFSGTGVNQAELSYVVWPATSTSEVKFHVPTLGQTGRDIVAHIAENSQIFVDHLDAIDGGGADHTGATDTQTITSVSSTDTSALIAFTETTGSGVIHVRNFWNYTLTNSSTVNWERSRSGNATQWALQVIDFEGTTTTVAEAEEEIERRVIIISEAVEPREIPEQVKAVLSRRLKIKT